MANKNITMKQYNGSSYDNLYPETTASQIKSGTLSIERGGTGATNIDDARIKLGAASTVTYTVSIPYSGWTTWDGGQTKTVSVSGITASDNPIVDVIMRSNATENKNYSAAWKTVQRITTADNSITIYTVGDPKVAFKIQLKVVR